LKKLLPVLLIVLGIGGGAAAGLFLKPAVDAPPADAAEAVADGAATDAGAGVPPGAGGAAPAGRDEGAADVPRSYVQIGRQTIVPVVEGNETKALMLFELAVDVASEDQNLVVDMEPRLRDAFLRELLKMSHTGAFMSTFTDDAIIEELRRNLVSAARAHLGDRVNDVLILDVMRQEK